MRVLGHPSSARVGWMRGEQRKDGAEGWVDGWMSGRKEGRERGRDGGEERKADIWMDT